MLMCFSSEDVQKSDDVKISRQFKESVIRPILKVTQHKHTDKTPCFGVITEKCCSLTISLQQCTVTGLRGFGCHGLFFWYLLRLITEGTSFWVGSMKSYTSCRSVTQSWYSWSAKSSTSGPRRYATLCRLFTAPYISNTGVLQCRWEALPTPSCSRWAVQEHTQINIMCHYYSL